MTTPDIDYIETHTALVVLHAQLANRRNVIAHILRLALSQLEGALREKLIECLNCLDLNADVMRQDLDAIAQSVKG